MVKADEGNSQRRKTRKYFSASSHITKKSKPVIKEEIATEKAPPKRKGQKSDDRARNEFKPSPAKRFRKGDYDDDIDFAPSPQKKMSADTKALKNKNSSSGTVPAKRLFDGDKSDGHNDKGVGAPSEGGGRGRGWRGRGRRGGFMSFGERKDPPHKGEKEVPEGVSDCLAGLTFATSVSSEREDAEDLIKRRGCRSTRYVNKKTNYLLADEDIGGNKSKKAKDLCTTFLKEDGLFDMIRKSKPKKAEIQKDIKNKTPERKDKLLEKVSHMKYDLKDSQAGSETKIAAKDVLSSGSSQMEKNKTGDSLTWTVKYCPKVPKDIIGNQSHVKQLHDWLANWRKVFLHHAQKATGKKQNDSAAKKAVLISGSPGIGKSISAKLVSRMLGFHYFEVIAPKICVNYG